MKALSLFSGIGGIDLAAEWAGIETAAFCEREPFCQKVLAKQWPTIPIYDDVCTLTKERLEADGIGTIDIIHGGYPCQPFSLAGQREGTNDNRHLWPEVFRLIQTIQPKWFVGENVAGHVTLGLDVVLSDLDSIGYSTEAFVIPAAAVGAQHRRERVFILAYSNVRYEFAKEKIRSGWNAFGFGGKNVANSNSESKPQGNSFTGTLRSEWKPWDNACRSSGGHEPGIDWWASEPTVDRVAHGVSDRMDRGKALGNAVVPQQIYPILAAIKQIDDLLKGETA